MRGHDKNIRRVRSASAGVSRWGKETEDGWRYLNTLPFALYVCTYMYIQYLSTYLANPNPSTSPSQLNLVNLTQFASSSPTSPTQPHSVHPRPVSLIHQIHSSQTHMLVNFTLVILSGHPWPNYSSAQYLTTQTVWKEERKELPNERSGDHT